jgi:LuxR family maltose regulon positive regulatory protein
MEDGSATQLQQGRRRIIERPRLTRLLDESSARIKMLVAPAGYGKTTLARQWTADKTRAWFRVAPAAVDVASVARGVAAAAAEVVPDCNRRLEERLRITKSPDAEYETLAEILAEDVDSWPPDAWLVLDDAQHVLERDATSKFIASLVRDSAFNTLLCTRHRPAWITARDLLYGNALEIGRNILAMTHQEAAEVMPDTPATPGVVALADGWPAVVGLASLTPQPTLMSGLTAGLPEALYDYLAEELYQSLSSESQDSLCLIAVAGVRSRRLIEQLFPAGRRERALRDAVEAGWLTTDADGNFELHPLLEAFLRQKLDEEPRRETRTKAKHVTEMLIQERQWDEAFDVIQRYGISEALLPLLRASLEDLLTSGRTGQLRTWLALADTSGVSGPESDLASAELLFREGRFHESEMRALASAEALSPDDSWASRAFSTAGRAAHAANREREAFQHYRVAQEVAQSQADEHVAALGQLVAAIDLELPDAPSLLAQLAPDPEDVDGLVLFTGRSLGLHTRFGTPADLDEARRVNRLLHLVSDPMIRCSYRNTYGYTVATAAEIDETEAVVAAQLADAREYRLDFVIPYTHLIQALLHLVRGRFEELDTLLSSVEEAGRAAGDDLLTANCAAIRARLLISQGRFRDATSESLRSVGKVTPSMQGELVAVRAIALACNREDGRALQTADAATAMTGAIEAYVGSRAARAIVALNRAAPDIYERARETLSSALELHSVDFFITAYRGAPELAQVLLESDETRERMLFVLTAAGDVARFDTIHRAPSGEAGTWEELSPREREVLSHVAAGLSNREIGSKLFIAEATVKVHISHIFEKLGVSSRTAAALRVPHHARPTQRAAREPRSDRL